MTAAFLAHRAVAPLLPDVHISVDGTPVKAWASMEGFTPKADEMPTDDGPGSSPGLHSPAKDHPQTTEIDPTPRPTRQSRTAEVGFRGEKRSDATRASTTDPETHLCNESPATGAMLSFMGHALLENRTGLIGTGDLTQATARQNGVRHST